MNRVIVGGLLILTAACANSFSTTYKGTGPASEALAWSRRAQARHETLARRLGRGRRGHLEGSSTSIRFLAN